MARYQQLYVEADEKLQRLQKERSAVDRLVTRLVAFEAAMRVIARHQLMAEFAAEILKAEDGDANRS